MFWSLLCKPLNSDKCIIRRASDKIKESAMVLFGTEPDRNRVTWETPSSEAIPFRRKPPTRPGANAGMKRTSVVEHNLYFARLAIVG
jgi:hypothetical protein